MKLHFVLGFRVRALGLGSELGIRFRVSASSDAGLNPCTELVPDPMKQQRSDTNHKTNLCGHFGREKCC